MNISSSRLITLVGEEKLAFLLSITRNFAVSVQRGALERLYFYCGTLCVSHITFFPYLCNHSSENMHS